MMQFSRSIVVKALIPLLFVSFADIKCKKIEKLSFDLQDKNIGYENSPNPITLPCLAPQTFQSFSDTLYHGAAVEPTITINPMDKHQVVAAWQQDRFFVTGSLDIGIAHSENGGRDWPLLEIPFQNCNGGFIQRATDVWLSYAADGSRVYLIALVENASTDLNTQNQMGVVVAYSTDNGATWSIPHFIAGSLNSIQEPTGLFSAFDKTSITADPLIANNAYAVWDTAPEVRNEHSETWFSRTTDGGLAWETSRLIYNPSTDPGIVTAADPALRETINNIIVGLPDGDLLCFMTRIYPTPTATDSQFEDDLAWPFQFTVFDIAYVRSTDHGATWPQTEATQVAVIDYNQIWTCGYTYDGSCNVTGAVDGGMGVRSSDFLFDVAVNPDNGNLYVVWNDSRFNINSYTEIALARSRDGGFTWSSPVQVNTTPNNAPNPQAFTCSVAVNKQGHVGLLYHDFRKSNVAIGTCTTPGNCTDQTKTNAWFNRYIEVSNPNGGSTGVGLDYAGELRVSEPSYFIENGPNTSQGVMPNGDYNDLEVLGDDFHAIYIKSHRGPFTPALSVLDNIDTTGVLILDNNYRTSPYFSKIDG